MFLQLNKLAKFVPPLKILRFVMDNILILNEKMLVEKIDYIHLNPVKRGYVEKPEHWLYSSARNYLLNDHTIIKIDNLPM